MEKDKHLSIPTIVFGNDKELLNCCFSYLMSTFRCLPLNIHD